ncbi:hypothetical protein [Nocardia sp. NPDC004711]
MKAVGTLALSLAATGLLAGTAHAGAGSIQLLSMNPAGNIANIMVTCSGTDTGYTTPVVATATDWDTRQTATGTSGTARCDGNPQVVGVLWGGRLFDSQPGDRITYSFSAGDAYLSGEMTL